MKKKILAVLAVLGMLVCFTACNKDASANVPANPPTDEEVLPEFPENDFGKDNETVYPDAWN